jgi:hypothetical protein
MLGFDQKPDRVFSAIVEAALEYTADLINDHLESSGDDQQAWADHFLGLAPWFPPRVARETLKQLLMAHRDPQRIYRLTDYHRLLIYKCLANSCDLHNDDLKIPPGQAAAFGPHRIGPIDLDMMVENFFPDLDFLHGEELLQLAGEDRQQRRISDEAFNIAARLPVHPDELTLVACADEDGWLTREDDEYPSAGWIAVYPREAEGADE